MGSVFLLVQFLLVFSQWSQTMVAAKTGDQWQKNFTSSDWVQWQKKSDLKVICTFQKQTSISKLKLKTFLDKDSDTIDKTRSSALGFIGIKDWNKTKTEWIKSDEIEHYQISGTYKNVTADLVYFYEDHFIAKDEYFQILLTGPKEIPQSEKSECLELSKSLTLGGNK